MNQQAGHALLQNGCNQAGDSPITQPAFHPHSPGLLTTPSEPPLGTLFLHAAGKENSLLLSAL